MGQVNRVDSCKLAVERAGERARGAVAASDAFFPFADGARILIDAGVKAIVEPGGSIRDDEVIAACAEAVSYTHLDVYKRQPFFNRCWTPRRPASFVPGWWRSVPIGRASRRWLGRRRCV